MRLPTRAVPVLVIAALTAISCPVDGKIHELRITGDSRSSFHIETFGFLANGVAELEVKSFGISPLPPAGHENRVGFALVPVTSESDSITSVEIVSALRCGVF